MQFIARTEEEYISTIHAIVDAEIYDELAVVYAVDISPEGVINKLPTNYPVMISLEIEELNADNRRYAFTSCKFHYIEDINFGDAYVDKLDELRALDVMARRLHSKIETSGLFDKPIVEYEDTLKLIEKMEKELF